MTSSEFLKEYELWLSDQTTKYEYFIVAAKALLRRAPERYLALDFVTQAAQEHGLSRQTVRVRTKFLEFIKAYYYQGIQLENDLEKVYRTIDSELVEHFCIQNPNKYVTWLRYLITDLQLKEIIDVKEWYFSHGLAIKERAMTFTVIRFLDWIIEHHSSHRELQRGGTPVDLIKLRTLFINYFEQERKKKEIISHALPTKSELLKAYKTDLVSELVLSLILLQGLSATEIIKLKNHEIRSGVIKGLPVDPFVQQAYNKQTLRGLDRDPVLIGLSVRYITILANRFLGHYKLKGDGVNGLRKL